MDLFILRIVCFLLLFGLAAAQVEDIVAWFNNVKVTYFRQSNLLQIDFDIEAVDPDVVTVNVGLTLLIDGQEYSWEIDGDGTDCVIDPNLCPLPFNQWVHVRVSAPPQFALPDSVWSHADPIGTFTFTNSDSDGAWGHSNGVLTHVNFVPGGITGASGQSKGAAWISGLATVGLLIGSGAMHLLGMGSAALSTNAHSGGTVAMEGISSTEMAAVAAAGGAHVVSGTAENPNGTQTHVPTVNNAETGQGAAHTSGGSAAQPAPASHGPPISRMDPIMLFLQFQIISTTGLLSVNYPPLYRGFTANFAWANFILPISGFVDGATHANKCEVSVNGGIALYATQLGIDPQDMFLVAWFMFLCLCAMLVGLYILIHAFLYIKVVAAEAAEASQDKEVWMNRRKKWGQMTSNTSLRLMYLGLGSLTMFIFYQWTVRCTSGATIFASLVALCLIIGSLGSVSFLILRLSRTPEGLEQLFNEESTYARRWSSLYNTFKETKLNFLVWNLSAAFVRRVIIGFGQHSGLAQNILLLLLELGVCIGLYKYKPYYSEGYNRLIYLIAGMNVVSYFLILPFNYEIQLSIDAAWGIAVVLVIFHSILAFAIAVLTVIKLGWEILRSKHIAFQSNKGIFEKFLGTEKSNS